MTTKTLTGLIAGFAITASLGTAALGQDTSDAASEGEAVTETMVDAAVADVANGTAFGDWVIACEAVSVRETVCRLVQTLTLVDQETLVANFVAVPTEGGAILVAQLPMGVYLPGGAVYRFAGNEQAEQRSMIWQSCQGQVCEAAAPLDTEELALIDEAGRLLFGYRMGPDSEPIVLDMDVSELSDGIAALRMAQADR
jgi:invasion protein IalB